MKLRALRLHGFKSFADRTEIAFNEGITAVVGPNGCGKSNISDAVRWVLGEQRPTAIRGARMEEAIFQGSVNRRQVSRASVSVEFSNEDGAFSLPFGVVEIARTVYRDGGSDYFLNRAGCRLRDVQEACRDTGLGANAYAVIEHRMIDAILSDRAEERRGLFEEAAGIGKYKDRRREASRGLDRAGVDLQRLEDVIGEVEKKVRSLARQKGKAERYRALRNRRLDVEVAVARHRLAAFGTRLDEIRAALDGGEERAAALRARVETEEMRLESLKTQQLESERARTAAATQVDRLRSELVSWERECAVAQEGAAHARRRIEQIGLERSDAAGLVDECRGQMAELAAKGRTRDQEKVDLVKRIEIQEGRTRDAGEQVRQARREAGEIEAAERRSARLRARLQGEADAADARAADLEGRLEELTDELAEAREALGRMVSQGDLFSDRLEELHGEVRLCGERLQVCRGEVARVRASLERARADEMRAQERHGALSARRTALERMERDREGVGPAAQALLSDPPEGVVGILADFIAVDSVHTRAVEAILGPRLRGVVVRDSDVAGQVAEWFDSEWRGGGGLLLLPLDRVPGGDESGSLLGSVAASGEGGPWARALLRGFELVAPPVRPVCGARGAARVSADGAWVERGGMLHLGNPRGTDGLLERKARLLDLGVAVGGAKARLDEVAAAREEEEARLALLEEALAVARASLEGAEDAWRIARSEQSASEDRMLSGERLVRDLEDRCSSVRDALERTREVVRQKRDEGARIVAELAQGRAVRKAASSALHRAEIEWEEAQGASSRLAVARARVEGDISRIRERESDMGRQERAARVRLAGLEAEEEELRASERRAQAVLDKGGRETERLSAALESEAMGLRRRDQALEELHARLADGERRVREVRSDERAAVDERHGLELEEQEVQGHAARIRERLETEWGRSLERLFGEAREIEGEESGLLADHREILRALERIGPVNMLAVEEHEEERARLAFLTRQRDDLSEAREDLRSAIQEINSTAVELFEGSFSAIRDNFRDTFLRLFEGGECDLRLRDPEDPLETAIEIHAAPRGKRRQSIELLSGGERALTALALLFAIYLVKPSPFCVLDEVDAPLDEANIERFVRLLNDFKGKTQFVVITHNPRTIEAADWIYGVTMEEPGVSSVVGVQLDGALGVASEGIPA